MVEEAVSGTNIGRSSKGAGKFHAGIFHERPENRSDYIQSYAGRHGDTFVKSIKTTKKMSLQV